MWATDRVRPPLFHRLLSQHPVPPTPEGSSRLLPGSAPLPWPSPSLNSSAPSCSPLGANISTLQDSLDVTGCCFAPLPQRVTSLQHIRSPRCTGCLLRGPLAVTTTGLAPVSRSMTFQGTRANGYAICSNSMKRGTSYNPPVKRKIFSCDFEETENRFSFGDTSPASPFGLPIDSTNLSLRRTVDLIVTFIRCAPLERDHPSSLIQIPKFK